MAERDRSRGEQFGKGKKERSVDPKAWGFRPWAPPFGSAT